MGGLGSEPGGRRLGPALPMALSPLFLLLPEHTRTLLAENEGLMRRITFRLAHKLASWHGEHWLKEHALDLVCEGMR
eukprot:15461216-Alexandrium_andersonii.AAC.1